MTNKYKEKVLCIKGDIFRFKLLYFNCRSEKQFLKQLKETKYETNIKEYEVLNKHKNIKSEGSCFYTEQGPVIWASKNKIQNVIHEVLHASISICENIGIPITQENSEPLCYIVTHIIENIYEGGKK